MANKNNFIDKKNIPTIIVCALLIICASIAIFLSGYDWHRESILGGLSGIGKVDIEQTISEQKEPEEWDYFNDTVFVGDSITYGIASYGYLDFNHVFAKIGLHQGTALYSKCVYTSKTNSMTIADALKIAKPGKVIVTLGINAVYSYKSDNFYTNYLSFIRKIKEATPNSIIIIQSVLPVTEKWSNDNGVNNSNERVAYINEKLAQMAEEQKCLFLYTYEDFANEKGFLKEEYSGDGIHLSRKGYEALFNYILTHPVQSSGNFTKIGAVRPPVVYNPTSSTVTLPSFSDQTSSEGETNSNQSGTVDASGISTPEQTGSGLSNSEGSSQGSSDKDNSSSNSSSEVSSGKNSSDNSSDKNSSGKTSSDKNSSKEQDSDGSSSEKDKTPENSSSKSPEPDNTSTSSNKSEDTE